MDDSRIKAYTYLFYYVLIDIRSASYTHKIKWWNPKSWMQAKKYLDEINNIADVFHNLPDFLTHRQKDFDETWFWSYLGKNLPDKYEFYHRKFLEMLNE